MGGVSSGPALLSIRRQLNFNNVVNMYPKISIGSREVHTHYNLL